MWIVFSLVSVMLPVISISRSSRVQSKRPWLWTLGSFAAALCVTCSQLADVMRRVSANDISGIMDTARANFFIAVVLSVVVLVLNLIALGVNEE